jgi:hypothetical protein
MLFGKEQKKITYIDLCFILSNADSTFNKIDENCSPSFQPLNSLFFPFLLNKIRLVLIFLERRI